jgi:hypothetical protein
MQYFHSTVSHRYMSLLPAAGSAERQGEK